MTFGHSFTFLCCNHHRDGTKLWWEERQHEQILPVRWSLYQNSAELDAASVGLGKGEQGTCGVSWPGDSGCVRSTDEVALCSMP